MHKGPALVGYLLTFLAGMGLMYAIDHSGSGVEIGAETASAGGGNSHASSPIPITEDDPTWGKPDAPVTIVEISDFECPFCSRVGPTIEQIMTTSDGRVRLVWRNFPLPFHQEAGPAAEAAASIAENRTGRANGSSRALRPDPAGIPPLS